MSEPTASRTGDPAIDYAVSRVGGYMPASGLCLQFTRENFAVPSYYGSAIDAWNGAQHQHPGDRHPPPGVPVFFHTPSPYRHVAFWVGDGSIVTTNGDKIQRWPDLATMESDFQGPYMGWTDDLNRYVVNPPTEHPDDDGEDDDMEYHGYSTKPDLDLPAGKWKTLPITDDDAYSIVSGRGPFQAQVQLTAEGLAAGHQLAVRFKLVDTRSGHDTVRASSYPITELIGSGGASQGQAAQYGTIGAAASGWTRRLRVEAMTYDDGVTVTSVQARGFQ